MSKKRQLIAEVFKLCRAKGEYTFDNALVKQVAAQIGFQNPFDATKMDDSGKLPASLHEQDYFVIHLGQGKHRFVKGIAHCFHPFEPIQDADIEPWTYQSSILNEYDSSESNVLSVGFNQRLIHKFLYADIVASPRMYLARRTKASFSFRIAQERIHTNQVQMEIDCTTEYNGRVTIFECKNGFPKDFAVYQLYFPFLYYYQLKETNQLAIKDIDGCYLLREKTPTIAKIRMYRYTFSDPYDMSSIRLCKSAQYNLIKQNA